MILPVAGWAGERTAVSIPAEDYARYDQIITSKFLSSDTQLVLLERTTTTRISPEQEGSLTMAWFQQQAYFDGTLSAELVRDFVAVNQDSVRLEGRFLFGARYRFVTGDTVDHSLTKDVYTLFGRSDPAYKALRSRLAEEDCGSQRTHVWPLRLDIFFGWWRGRIDFQFSNFGNSGPKRHCRTLDGRNGSDHHPVVMQLEL